MAETIRIEVAIDSLNETEAALSGVIRNFAGVGTAARQAGLHLRKPGIRYQNLTVLRKRFRKTCPDG